MSIYLVFLNFIRPELYDFFIESNSLIVSCLGTSYDSAYIQQMIKVLQ